MPLTRAISATLPRRPLAGRAGAARPEPISPELISIEELTKTISGLGTGADLAFVVYAMQIRDMDKRVALSLQQIQHSSKLRDAIANRIGELRDLQAEVEKTGKDGKLCFGAKSRAPQKEEINLTREGAIQVEYGETMGSPNTYGLWTVSANEIDLRIKNLTAKVQKLDSDRELKMIMLNQMLNKKGQAVSQLTNLLKKSNDNRSNIINNMR